MRNAFALIVTVIALFITCKSSKNTGIFPPDPSKLPLPKDSIIPPAVKDELIVWKGGVKTKEWFKNKIKLSYGDDIDMLTCESCDGRLELWKGKAIELFLNSETVRSSSEKPKASGEDTLFYSRNFYIKAPIDKNADLDSTIKIVATKSAASRKLVAVFDTGIDPRYIRVERNSATCKTEGINGWNFVENTSNTMDNHKGRHGTIVTKYIIDNAGNEKVDILPVKVLGKEGQGDLFKFLCGVAYAANSGATVFNASLGFYYYDREPPILLDRYLSEYIVKGRTLICAAGNADYESDKNMITMYGSNVIPYLRNIDVHYFFPAGLSETNQNIISITTVGKAGNILKVSPQQNYSKSKVKYGVEHDQGFMFKNPLNPAQLIPGSSYAAPIFTGIFIKFDLMPELSDNSYLNYFIKNGKYLGRD